MNATANESNEAQTTSNQQSETLGFQTEVKQLLHLMVHSLYSNKEIFLRELISNASDAVDKLRFEALEAPGLLENDAELSIHVDFDKEAGTITVTDNGIGMSRDEAITHLGTIAKSGTSDFLQSLTGDQRKDSHLIGQFGVGFYSSFIVSDKVTVLTRRADAQAEEGVKWESSGEGEFIIDTVRKPERGTSIILHLKKDETEFADGFRLRSLIREYSDHISIPIMMNKEQPPAAEDDKDKDDKVIEVPEEETVNTATALWTRSRNEVKEEEYKEFYKHVSHDFEDPLDWSHNRVEGKLEYTSLLYIPGRAPFDLYQREAPRGLKLYIQRVFIMDNAEQFLPLYLRFVKGVVDCKDLSLNISREILQKDPNIEKIKSALTKRVLSMLEKMAKGDKEKYAAFWGQFGQVIKEGVAEDFANKDRIAKLVRFSTTYTNKEVQDQSLDDYLSRLQDKQDKIYYVVAENFNTAKNSPHLEIFRKKDVEVILLYDRIDEWLMGYLPEYEGKQFQAVSKGALDLGQLDSEEDKKAQEKVEKEYKSLVKRVKDVLSDQVEDVRITHRLTDSPACVAIQEGDMSAQMKQMLEAAGQKMPDSKPVFELNPDHALVQKLDAEKDDGRFKELSFVLFDQAQLAEGNSLADPATYVQRLNKLLVELAS